MAKTRHMQQRMDQRGIEAGVVELALQYGEWEGDRCVLNGKACDYLIDQLNKVKKKALNAKSKGGLVVVEAGGQAITTYRLDSFARGRKS